MKKYLFSLVVSFLLFTGSAYAQEETIPPVEIKISTFKNAPCGQSGPSSPLLPPRTNQKCLARDFNYMIRKDLKDLPDYKPTLVSFLTTHKGFSVKTDAPNGISPAMQAYVKKTENGSCTENYCLTYYITQTVYPSYMKIKGVTFYTPKGKFTKLF